MIAPPPISARGGGGLLYCIAVHERDQRRRLGAWYTPDALVAQVVRAALDGTTTVPLRVVDPACGDGRFLAEVRRALNAAGHDVQLCGVDVDPAALDAARQRLGAQVELIQADALAYPWGDRHFDLVVGNPPFLSPLTAGNTARLDGSTSVYADAAVAFWQLAHRLARPQGGRVGFVLPLSVLASRDAGPVRQEIARSAACRWWWWAPRPMFPDAQVITGALVTERGGQPLPVRRQVGPSFDDAQPVTPPAPSASPASTWTWLVADDLGLPPLHADALATAGTLVDHATARGDFRDQYYGLVGAVVEDGDGPPLVTSGLIDPGRCWWGERPVRFAGQRYARPTVDLSRLDSRLLMWARRRLVPKVLVASQTRVIEAVADPAGRWLPSVPVISVSPAAGVDPWEVAAVLSGPVASLWLAHQSAGTGRSARVVRVSAPVLARVPWPAGSMATAAAHVAAGQLQTAAQHTLEAYGVQGDQAVTWLEWWRSALPRGGG